ncbi:MAG: hypothetical protein D3921_15240 [Candidatus Electrothrix sp. AW1]|nr:hypothetical protein [Candidatus Electrothrix gigas]
MKNLLKKKWAAQTRNFIVPQENFSLFLAISYNSFAMNLITFGFFVDFLQRKRLQYICFGV